MFRDWCCLNKWCRTKNWSWWTNSHYKIVDKTKDNLFFKGPVSLFKNVLIPITLIIKLLTASIKNFLIIPENTIECFKIRWNWMTKSKDIIDYLLDTLWNSLIILERWACNILVEFIMILFLQRTNQRKT